MKWSLFIVINCFYGSIVCCLAFSASVNRHPPVSSSTLTNNNNQKKPIIPITLLSGFLGSGKTTLLQQLLENEQGLKIAIVVNDVASINIDSKLIANEQNKAAGMIELQNGCACCSKSDELLASFAELVTLSDLRQDDECFDHIVVELSGVADPRAVRSQWQEAEHYQMPLTERLRLDTLVTVVDCSTFFDFLQSEKGTSLMDAPELFYRNSQEAMDAQSEEEEESLYDRSRLQLSSLIEGFSSRDKTDSVAGLMAAQIETSDVVLLNKIDMAESSMEVARIREIIQVLTAGRADVTETVYGKVPIDRVLGVARGRGVALAGLVDDHHDAIQGATANLVANQDNHHYHNDNDYYYLLHLQ